MSDPVVFVDGLPARITIADFRRYHGQSFPKLLDARHDRLLEDAVDDVYAMFHGVQTLWDRLDKREWFDKTRLAFRMLAAWHVVELYPTLSFGVASMGGVPLRRRRIGGVDVFYADNATMAPYKNYRDLLGFLRSNVFGHRAYNMIKGSGKLALARAGR